ncbi:uncharacterized protein J8A68_001516 [[Candida] subhashii]|uniref:K Homology domain-containing protein n=1 Tax=[Candida] subhashii TaxID=561895 RepID=A0A8J5R2T8_9ASCO|nr:uncharacterized protein J8A68_001516 [[Candida] subhashii]KAG7664930.1 hypothetical protein J8A68_001516 [[Candida] subhashii]
MIDNLVILNLEHSFLIDPKVSQPETITYYETNTGLWKTYHAETFSYRMIDNLYPIHQIANQINVLQRKLGNSNNHISIISPSANSPLINVFFHGDQDFVCVSRARILQQYNHINYKSLTINEMEFMAIDEQFTQEMTKLCNRYQVEIIINNNKNAFSNSGKTLEQGYVFHIVGQSDNITICEASLRILIDTILNNYVAESIDIELSMIPIVGGFDLFNFNQIAKQTNCNIYVPDLLPNLFSSKVVGNNKDMKIWITSKNVSELVLGKSILSNLIESGQQRELITKEIHMTKDKLDSMVLYNQHDVLNIMFKYGTFILLPGLGEEENYIISVQGNSLETLNECINEINLIPSNYYRLEITGSEVMDEFSILQLVQLKKTCVATTNAHGLEISGSCEEIRHIMKQLPPQAQSTSIKLRLELSNGQRDFISGKKNGKLLKIINELNKIPSVKFSAYNEYNFYLDVEVSNGSNVPILNKTLDLIELELPAELTFNVPEVFHKSIIGNGGSIIQSIMKKYNVFIKFSFSNKNASNAYSLKRTNNVLIKCPRKNARNISLAKDGIDQMVENCCMNNIPYTTRNTTVYHTLKFQLWRSHYLMIINSNKIGQVNKMESDYSCFIDFPVSIGDFKDSNELIVDIKGAESKVNACWKQLKTILPNNYEFRLTYSPGKFDEVFNINKQEFEDKISIPFKILLGIEVLVNEASITTNKTQLHRQVEGDHQIILCYFDNNKTNLTQAISSLTTFLREKGFLISDKKEMEFDPLLTETPVVNSPPIQEVNISTNPLRSVTNNFATTNGKLPAKTSQQKTWLPNKKQYVGHQKSMSTNSATFVHTSV